MSSPVRLPGREQDSGSRGCRPAGPGRTIRTAALLLFGAALIHLVLTPEHFEERFLYGIFFLAAVGFQVTVGWLLLRRPSPRTCRWAALGNLLLLATWVVTRAVAPPLSPDAAAEAVDLVGVGATGLELAAIVLLAPWLSPRTQRATWVTWMWASGAALGFAGLLLFASGALSYYPDAPQQLGLDVFDEPGLQLTAPLFYGLVAPKVWLVASWSTLALGGLATVLVGANVAAMLNPGRGGRPSAGADDRRAVTAAMPVLLAVSSCCGVPLALFLGASGVIFLYRLTPWLLMSTVALLAFSLAGWRADRTATPDRHPTRTGRAL